MNKPIAIQGILGSYHHEATCQYFNEECALYECLSFRQLTTALRDKEVDTALMAIENTIAGSILPNYALISRMNLKIVGETYLKIHHHLLCHPDSSMEKITEVHSHPMALLQCEKFFEKHPNIKLVETEDTAKSAKDIAENQWQNVAAIAPKKSAEIYKLKILNDKIQTNKENYTRFFVLSREENPNEIFDKVSLRFSLKNYSGSLVNVLQEISRLGVDMTKIQSVPLVFTPGEYSFYVDFLVKDLAQYNELIACIKEKITDLEILGKYLNGIPKWWKQTD